MKAATDSAEGNLDEAKKALKKAIKTLQKSVTAKADKTQELIKDLEGVLKRLRSRSTWSHGGYAHCQQQMSSHAYQRSSNSSSSYSSPQMRIQQTRSSDYVSSRVNSSSRQSIPSRSHRRSLSPTRSPKTSPRSPKLQKLGTVVASASSLPYRMSIGPSYAWL
eukprot:g18871.t1